MAKLRLDLQLTGFKQAQAKLNNFSKQTAKLGKSLSTKLTAPLVAVGGLAIAQAAKFEKLQTTLNVLTGSAEKGAKAFKNLVKFSAGTPFQLDQLVKANNTMMGFGISADEAASHLKAIGDIAAVSGGDLQGITVAFSQVAASGRLMGQDLLQLINNGVPIIDMLSNSMGVAKSEIKGMVSEGAVTFPVLLKAFQDATSEGGKFHNGMGTLSQTLSGLGSTLRDNLNIALAELGTEIVTAFDLKEKTKQFIVFIQNLTEKFKALSPATKKTILIIAGIATTIGPVLLTVAAFTKAIVFITSAFTTLGSGLLIVKAAFLKLNMAMLLNPFVLITTAIIGLITYVVKLSEKMTPLVSGWQTLKNVFKSGGNAAKFAALQLSSQAKAEKEAAEETKLNTEETDKLTKANEDLLKSLKDLEGLNGKGGANKENQDRKVKTVSAFQEKEQKTIRNFDGSQMQEFTNMKVGFGLATVGTDPIAQMVEGMKKSKPLFDQKLQEAGNFLNQKLDGTKERLLAFQHIGLQMGQSIQNTFTNMGHSIASGLGAGESALGTFAGVLIETAMTAIGASLATTMGFGAESAGATAKSFGPLAAFVLPALLAGAAVAVKGAFGKIDKPKKFAKGGIISTPTMGLMGEYPGARSNPEVVAPLDKLKNMIGERGSSQVQVGGSFTVKGQDLVVALQRANKNRDRIL